MADRRDSSIGRNCNRSPARSTDARTVIQSLPSRLVSSCSSSACTMITRSVTISLHSQPEGVSTPLKEVLDLFLYVVDGALVSNASPPAIRGKDKYPLR